MSELLFLNDINLAGHKLKEIGGMEFDELTEQQKADIRNAIGVSSDDADAVAEFKLNHPEFVIDGVYQTLDTYDIDDVLLWQDYLSWLNTTFTQNGPTNVPWSDSDMVRVTKVDLTDSCAAIVFQLNNKIYKMITDDTKTDSWNIVDLADLSSEDTTVIIDNLDSNDSTAALSAKQGKVLNTNKADKSELSDVAFSGEYSDLKNKPTIPEAYTLPVAKTNELGGIKPDGSTIQVDSNGVASSVIADGSISKTKLDGFLQSDIDGSVKFNKDQELTEEQKAKARENIGAVDANANVASANLANNLTPESSDSVKDENVSFIGRTTAGSTSIPETGVTKLDYLRGAVADDGETCFNPALGFLSTSNNWFLPNLVNEGYRLDSTGLVVADAQYTLVFVPTIAAEAGSGKNNGFLIYFGDDAVETTLGYVGYRATIPAVGESCTILTPTTRNGVANTYGGNAVGWMCISVKSTDYLCIHPVWSGNWNTIYYEPTINAIATIPTLPHGLGNLDYLVRTTNTSCRLYQNQKQIKFTDLTWSMTTNSGEGETSYVFTADLPNDGKSGGEIHKSSSVDVTLTGTTLTITSSSIDSLNALNTYLGNHTLLYQLDAAVTTDYDLSGSISNSDLGGEFFMTSQTALVTVAPSSVTLLYGVDLKGSLRDLLKQEPIAEEVSAASHNVLYNMVKSILDNIIGEGIDSMRINTLTVLAGIKSIATTLDIIFPSINTELKSITTAPETYDVGDRFYNSTAKKIQTWNGTDWTTLAVNPSTTVYYYFDGKYYQSNSSYVLSEVTSLPPLSRPTRLCLYIDNISATRHIWLATDTKAVADYIQIG